MMARSAAAACIIQVTRSRFTDASHGRDHEVQGWSLLILSVRQQRQPWQARLLSYWHPMMAEIAASSCH
jgi:hypothetical protein